MQPSLLSSSPLDKKKTHMTPPIVYHEAFARCIRPLGQLRTLALRIKGCVHAPRSICIRPARRGHSIRHCLRLCLSGRPRARKPVCCCSVRSWWRLLFGGVSGCERGTLPSSTSVGCMNSHVRISRDRKIHLIPRDCHVLEVLAVIDVSI